MSRNELLLTLIALSLAATGCAREKTHADPASSQAPQLQYVPDSRLLTKAPDSHILREERVDVDGSPAPTTQDSATKQATKQESGKAQDAFGKIASRHLGVPAEVVDQYLIVGHKVWDIVEKSKPVVDVRSQVVSVLPVGEMDWQKMSGWSRTPVTKTHVESVKQWPLKYEVARFAYTISATFGGTYNGKGKYLANVSVIPDVRVNPTFKISSRAEIGQVLNVGTEEDPIVSVEVRVNWKISNLRTRSRTDVYVVTGDGTITKVDAD